MSSPPSLSTAGQVVIDACWRNGVLDSVSVASRRPAAAQLFIGKSADQVLALVPRLFSLCGKAQSAVAAAALATASGQPLPAGDGDDLRREAIGEHLWRLLLDWPQQLLAGEAGYLQKKSLNAAFANFYRQLRRPENESALFAAIAACLDDYPLATQLDALRPWDALAIPTHPALPSCLPVNDRKAIGAMFVAADARFSESPVWQSRPAEVGGLAEGLADPEVSALYAAGRPLAARLLVRRRALATLLADRSGGWAPEALARPAGVGCAWAMTARGPLCHRVELQSGRVVDYQLIAPTEWNFHPQSAWLAHLRGARAETPEIAENLLRLWALALDPCVPVSLTLIKD